MFSRWRAIASRRRYDAGMGRTLAILKYVPAVLCGLLVVAWVVSLKYRQFGVAVFEAERLNNILNDVREPPFQVVIYFDSGSLVFYLSDAEGATKPHLFAYAHQRY